MRNCRACNSSIEHKHKLAKFCSQPCKDSYWQANNWAYHKSKQGNPEYLAKRRHHEALRRARKLQATPKWLSKAQLEEIKTIYRNCPVGFHVDHIMPLKGKDMSGLHVPWNLQYLPGIVNKMKSNKVDYGNSN